MAHLASRLAELSGRAHVPTRLAAEDGAGRTRSDLFEGCQPNGNHLLSMLKQLKSINLKTLGIFKARCRSK